MKGQLKLQFQKTVDTEGFAPILHLKYIHIITLIKDLVPLLKKSQKVPKKVKKGQLKLHFQKILYTDGLGLMLHSMYTSSPQSKI